MEVAGEIKKAALSENRAALLTKESGKSSVSRTGLRLCTVIAARKADLGKAVRTQGAAAEDHHGAGSFPPVPPAVDFFYNIQL